MPNWTTAAEVKTALLNAFIGELDFKDEQVTFSGVLDMPLHNRLIVAGTIVAKWCLSYTPTEETKTLTLLVPQTLAHPYIMRESVMVGLNPVLTQTYVENHDYIIDYEAGTIRRADGSDIPTATTVYIWYLYYTVLAETTDYTVDEAEGTIRRVAGGDIPDGATILVDYQVTAESIADALIDQAILQAEDKILARLSSEYTTASTDEGLATGSTELALAIVCEALAIYALTNPVITEPHDRATELRTLAATLTEQAWRTLAPFTKTPLRSVTKTQNPAA